jgi:hypothetical protein
MSDASMDYRDTLVFWKARSTVVAVIATIALVLQILGFDPDFLPNADTVLEAVAVIGYLWAYVERLFGSQRLVLSKGN